MISNEIKDAIKICFIYNIPFAVYTLPQKNEVVFFANPSSLEESRSKFNGEREFVVNFFNNDYPYTIGIFPEMTAQELIANYNSLNKKNDPEIYPWSCNTEYLQYCSQAHQIIQDLRRYGGKTVLSRTITGKYDKDWTEVMDSYFSNNSNSFRYAYMTRETGCWLGATPEILFEKLSTDEYFQTMSLAGTRAKALHDLPWDKKNEEEHNYVTEYIVSTLANMCIATTVGEKESIGYGEIEHLCHRIIAKSGDKQIQNIIERLSPTPAVLGYPIENALSDIQNYEVHPRYCYAGYVGVTDDDGTHVFVNLRCVHFNSERFCIYGGGGLTALSNEEDEWNEIEAKTQGLRKLLF